MMPRRIGCAHAEKGAVEHDTVSHVVNNSARASHEANDVLYAQLEHETRAALAPGRELRTYAGPLR